ncbi:hypothetical protein ACSBR1_021227 [Camellia fascicularis]
MSNSQVSIVQGVYASVKGLMRTHSPSVVIAVSNIDFNVMKGLEMVSESSENDWNKMKISINTITQNRAYSLTRLLNSLNNSYYLGDEISITVNMDSKVDEPTIKLVNSFKWPHGPKTLRRRIIQGGLIRTISESGHPASNDDCGLLLEDDIEVSPYYYLWIKYALLKYQAPVSDLSSISLYMPRLVEAIKESPKWNAIEFFKHIHPNTPYLHQLPCSWGALFFPKAMGRVLCLYEHEVHP